MATKSITKEAFLVMKRCFSLLLAIVMALAATACRAKPQKVDPAAFCIQESVALTQEMGAMAANQMYMDLVSDSEEVRKLTDEIGAQDYSRPVRVYLIALPPSVVNQIFSLASPGETLPDDLQEILYKRMNGAMAASFINGRLGGVSVLAAASLLTTEKAYIEPDGWPGGQLLFLQYEGGWSSVVSFAHAGEGVIGAKAEFALVSDEIVSDLDSLIAMFLTDTFEFDYIVYEGDELAALLGSGS